MKFRTEVHIPESANKIDIEDQIFSIGSCFASEMSELFKKGQLQTLNNPFGTIFNPYSINLAIDRICNSSLYTEDDLIFFNDEYISLDHHSSFNASSKQEVLNKINDNIKISHDFLKSSKWVIITFGTSFIYRYLPQDKWVANCHKIPNHFFEKELMKDEDIAKNIEEITSHLKKICQKDVQILFTVSPVRHTKDGMVENQWSKSKLINQLQQVVSQNNNRHYLPIYEIMMDDLRDYRFYKEDMIHPTEQAVRYIFEKFKEAYCSTEAQEFINDNFKILKSLQHKSLNQDQEKYQLFLDQLKSKIEQQQSKVKHRIFNNDN